jgi:hypothetical protein
MKKNKHLMIWIGLLLSLVSCKDTMEAIGLGGDEIPAEGLVLNLQLTNFTKQQIGTRAGASETFNSLCAVFYGDNNEYLSKTDCSKSTLSQQSDGSYKVRITNVPAGTKNVHLVANASDMTESEAQNLQSLTAAEERDPQLDAPICWGKISIDSLLKANPSVTMLRQCAKISLEIDKGIQSYFTNAGLYVYNMATKAAIAPANYIEPTTDDLAESTVLRTEDNPLGGGTATTVAVNETSAGKAMVIIKANYKDSEGHDREGYYKVALYKDANKTTQYALLRNHHYTIKVTKVNDYGFSTLEEAKKSLPENRLEVEVVDDNPEITQMIACKDYELGVSDCPKINANTTEATVTIVTTLPKATSSDDKLYGVQKNASWITACDQETENDTPVPGRKSSKGKKYTLKLTLTKNDQSENSRTGTITVTSGDLSLDITIKQAGFDFRKDDPERPVTMQYNNSTVADNYFNWLDRVQGITPAEMQGAVRNDGLHFCVGTTDITYLITKLEGDKISKKDNKINVEEYNGKWKVSLANTTANEDLWKSSFTITNQADIEITYPVYHTGIFHKIDESSKVYTDYQLTENGDKTKKVKGWFYYGVVKVQGKKTDETTTTYYMLDRNLGASSNGYYAPDVVALEKNKKAIGGYFCISENKNTSDATQGDLSSTLAPEGYTIPTDAVFEELVNAGNLEVVPQSTSLGETYNCVRIKTVDSELPYIYLPMGGFLDGESHKNPIHVNLWTKTLLSGTQGFGTNSPEYGFWYRYFDVYNKRIGLSNMRFVSGSNGMNNGRYKAMPIRLILK